MTSQTPSTRTRLSDTVRSPLAKATVACAGLVLGLVGVLLTTGWTHLAAFIASGALMALLLLVFLTQKQILMTTIHGIRMTTSNSAALERRIASLETQLELQDEQATDAVRHGQESLVTLRQEIMHIAKLKTEPPLGLTPASLEERLERIELRLLDLSHLPLAVSTQADRIDELAERATAAPTDSESPRSVTTEEEIEMLLVHLLASRSGEGL